MGELSKDLYNDGFERTERESPFDDDGILWRNSYELVCDETGIVIRTGDTINVEDRIESMWEGTPRYSNSNLPILPGGMQQSYDWGSDEESGFVY